MKQVWQLTIDEYIEIVEIGQELGLKPGESLEQVLLAYMEIKGRKPLGSTELSKEEFLREAISKDNKILNVSVDKEGKQTYTFIKKKEEPNVGQSETDI